MIATFNGPYRFLSNFWPCKIEYENITYPSVEHAYQAAKTINKDLRTNFTMGTPNAAKKLGRKVDLREDWEKVKVFIMHELLLIKFSKEPLKTKLINTHPKELVEGNTWGDTFWGECGGQGKNMLGKLLCEVRDELRTKEIK